MFAELTIQIKSNKRIKDSFAPWFQGALMDVIDSEYASYLHNNSLHPYSQHLAVVGDNVYWKVKCLDDDSFQYIIMKLLQPEVNGIYLKRLNAKVDFISKSLISTNEDILLEEFNNNDKIKNITIEFVTPTTFRLMDRYINYPDIHSIIYGIMKKLDSVSKVWSIYDEELLEKIESQIIIHKYNLRSTVYPVERVNIPGFTGKVTIILKDEDPQLYRCLRLLFKFAEYSGLGAKTGMGMGAIKSSVEYW